MAAFLEDLQRRKDAKDDPCDSCDASGVSDGRVCADCLGQGILLTRAEYISILTIAGHIPDDDNILDQQYFDE